LKDSNSSFYEIKPILEKILKLKEYDILVLVGISDNEIVEIPNKGRKEREDWCLDNMTEYLEIYLPHVKKENTSPVLKLSDSEVENESKSFNTGDSLKPNTSKHSFPNYGTIDDHRDVEIGEICTFFAYIVICMYVYL
jgi:hypothetical protein